MSEHRTYPETAALSVWAADLMATRAPDFVIGEERVYMNRWWVIPRNREKNIFLHEILNSDDPRAMHDHPWENETYVIEGSYIEHTPEGKFLRTPGDIVRRAATALHRLEILPGGRAVTLFTTGPTIREWGFQCPQGWVHWKEFTAPGNKGAIGKGCGE